MTVGCERFQRICIQEIEVACGCFADASTSATPDAEPAVATADAVGTSQATPPTGGVPQDGVAWADNHLLVLQL